MHACMYVCMHACMYACMHVCMYASNSSKAARKTRSSREKEERDGMHACIYVFMRWYEMHVCMYACMHVCMYACMYVFIKEQPNNKAYLIKPRKSRKKYDHTCMCMCMHV